MDPEPTPRSGASPRRVLDVVGWVIVVAAAIGATVAAFLPWLHTGASNRNSFGVVRAAQRLGVVDSSLVSRALSIWYFVPLLAAVVILLVALGRQRWAGFASIVLGVVVAGVALVAVTSSADTGGGPAVAFLAGASAVLGGTMVVIATRGARSGAQT